MYQASHLSSTFFIIVVYFLLCAVSCLCADVYDLYYLVPESNIVTNLTVIICNLVVLYLSVSVVT